MYHSCRASLCKELTVSTLVVGNVPGAISENLVGRELGNAREVNTITHPIDIYVVRVVTIPPALKHCRGLHIQVTSKPCCNTLPAKLIYTDYNYIAIGIYFSANSATACCS